MFSIIKNIMKQPNLYKKSIKSEVYTNLNAVHNLIGIDLAHYGLDHT